MFQVRWMQGWGSAADAKAAEAIRLGGMDRVRFGRALGIGARETAKALMKAADAAAAPNPEVTRKAGAAVAGKIEQVKVTTAGVKQGGKRFGEAMWGPFAKASSVLWLEVTGVLFGMFAAVAGVWAWNNRRDFMGSGLAAHQEWARVAMLGLFGYLTVSSYVRAARRNRR
jgi:hypothetical protein